MKNKTEYRRKIAELAQQLENGCSTPHILKEYMPKWAMPRRTLERYIAFAQDILASRMKKREQVIETVRADIIAHEAETWLKSTLEIEAKVCAIMSGKMEFYKTVNTVKGVENIKCPPSSKDVIHAIDLLLRLRGVYKAADGKTDNDIPVMPILVENEAEKALLEKIKQQAENNE